MNFIVSSSYLLKNLNSISGVITSNPVVPILENVLFEIEGGNLLITASDLQTSVMVELQVESKEDGSVAIPAKILIETLKNLPCLLYTSPSPRDQLTSRMPSSA